MMSKLHVFLALFGLCALRLIKVQAYSSGAGESACATGVPGGGNINHGVKGTANGGFTLQIGSISKTYTPNTQYSVSLSGSETFEGFLVTGEGSFSAAGGSAKFVDICNPGGAVTHASDSSKSSASFGWTAPTSGDVNLRVTVLNQFRGTYYIFSVFLQPGQGVNCDSSPNCDTINRLSCEAGTIPNTCARCQDGYYDNKGVSTGSNDNTCQQCFSGCETCTSASSCSQCISGYELSTDGSSCSLIQALEFNDASSIFSPSGCKDSDCKFQVWWQVAGDNMNFRVRAKTSGWAGIGISEDNTMPQTDMYTGHVGTDGTLRVINRYADGYGSPDENAEQNLFSVQGGRDGTYLDFQFARPLKSLSDKVASLERDAPKYHIFLAQGEGFFSRHGDRGASDGPLVISSPVEMQALSALGTEEYGPVRISTGVLAHCVMMMISWIALSPIASYFALYGKENMSWFPPHRGMQMLAVFTTIIGVIVIIPEVTFHLGNHQGVGIAVLILAAIQIFVAVCRNTISKKQPGSDDKGPRRYVFNGIHGILGRVIFIASVTAMFLGLDAVGAYDEAKYVMYVWLGVVGFLLIINKCFGGKDESTHRQSVLFQFGASVMVAICLAACVTLSVIVVDTPESM